MGRYCCTSVGPPSSHLISFRFHFCGLQLLHSTTMYYLQLQIYMHNHAVIIRSSQPWYLLCEEPQRHHSGHRCDSHCFVKAAVQMVSGAFWRVLPWHFSFGTHRDQKGSPELEEVAFRKEILKCLRSQLVFTSTFGNIASLNKLVSTFNLMLDYNVPNLFGVEI